MDTLIKSTLELETVWKTIKDKIQSKETLDLIKTELKEKQRSIDEINYKDVKNTFGVYIFYIKPKVAYNLKTLNKNWSEKGFYKYPKIIQKRFSKHLNINTNHEYVFYIGKSEKLGSRIREHITHGKTVSTYGLKLKERVYFNKQNITFSYWELPEELERCTKEIKQFIITQIESELREQWNPWVGKQ
jgi:hypothetical protein